MSDRHKFSLQPASQEQKNSQIRYNDFVSVKNFVGNL